MARIRLLRLLKVLGATFACAILVLVALARATHYFLDERPCDLLKEEARRPEVQRALESWVARNWTGDRIPLEDTLDGDGIVPGVRWLPARFDGATLRMGPRAHVRLLGVEARDELNDAIAPNVQALYFTERSRLGVVVQLRDREPFQEEWLQAEWLVPVSDTISVLCIESD